MTKNDWVLEWSRNQNSLHCLKADSCIEKNLNSLLSNHKSDYIPIMIGSRDDCEYIAKKFRDKLEQRIRKPNKAN